MDWTSWKGATCLPDCWCEATRTGTLILEPVNSWSNLFFVFAGIYFLLSAKRWTDFSNKLNSDEIFPKIYGLSLIFLGLGSFSITPHRLLLGNGLMFLACIWFQFFTSPLIFLE